MRPGIVFSVFFVWTIFLPLAGYGLLWVLNGIMAFGDLLLPERRGKILDHLRACASGTPEVLGLSHEVRRV